MYISIYLSLSIYIYIYTHRVYPFTYIYIYIHILYILLPLSDSHLLSLASCAAERVAEMRCKARAERCGLR